MRNRLITVSVIIGVLLVGVLAQAHAHVQDSKRRLYFGASTYSTDQPRTERPRARYRSDPVSVVWRTPDLKIFTTSASNHTNEHWTERRIPRRFPRGAEMNRRDNNPFCTSPQLVFNRGSLYTHDGWEQSVRYMSTNGICGNQYHIRMWNSGVHRRLFGPEHGGDWVLAPIHHERVTFSGHEIDLPFDQARFIYARVMSGAHCVDKRWRIHAYSAGVDYGDGSSGYSGLISRIGLRHC